MRTGQQLWTPRRHSGSRVEQRDQRLAAIECRVQGRKVANLKCDGAEPAEGSKGVQCCHSTGMWNEITQRTQRRAGLLHGTSEPAVPIERPHEQSKPQLEEG